MSRQLRRTMATTSAAPSPARRAMPRPTLSPAMGIRGAGIGRFLGEVRSELRKVIWPTRREATNLTILVVALSVATGLILGLIDFLFSELFRLLLR